MSKSSKTGLIAGISLFFIILFFIELDPSNPAVSRTAAAAVLMALLWITEAVPLAATSLIPLILFPLLGITDAESIAGSYINSTIFLFLGGFLLALAMERWDLHKRIALKIILIFGGSTSSIVAGSLTAAAFLSMWISNTATAVMMLPIALSIMHKLETEFGKDSVKNFSKTIMLSIAYGCSLGGIATLIGTPPNLAFSRIVRISFPESPVISFGNWMILALPVTIIMLFLVWLLLTKVYYKSNTKLKLDPQFINNEYRSLGRISFEEKTVGIIFSLTAVLWVTRGDLILGFITIPGWSNLLADPSRVNDGMIAVAMAFLLFFIPSAKEKGKRLLDAGVFQRVPWGIILLFGGGFALAEGFTQSGLSGYIGSKFHGMDFLSPLLFVLAVSLIVNFLTELTSNTAVAQMILPIMASVSIALGMHPYLLMIAATISSSMAFMLPVATPPNTIVFASERLTVADMAKAGFLLNITGVLVLVFILYTLGDLLFDFSILPEWMQAP
jgi:solute carrier family 13 (sodium-dependent dicarboxylate transporter), member 2/3/5